MSESVPFEGVEKRLVIQFAPEVASPYDMSGDDWQDILDEARCSIVSCIDIGGDHKVYLLSESTLFVWRSGFLLKTCGRTTPFLALKAFAAKALSRFSGNGTSTITELMGRVNWMTYSRLEFIHPKYQVYPHESFTQEVHYLKTNIFTNEQKLHTAHLDRGPNTFYCIFYASPSAPLVRPFYMVEALMSKIDQHCVRNLTGFDNDQERKAATPDQQSPIRNLIQRVPAPHALDEFWFDPCGYSANALVNPEAVEYFSCHVSPEPVTSYASLELASSTYNLPTTTQGRFDLQHLMPYFQAQSAQYTKVIITSKSTSPQPQDDSDAVFAEGDIICYVTHKHQPSPLSQDSSSSSSISTCECAALVSAA